MDIFGVLSFVGGLAMFLYGMSAMGDGLTKLSGGKLEYLLEKLTSKRIMAVLLGAGVTAVIQSSSATTVMVVGFVNSGIMKLNQAVGIIMGANIGTTITSWILSLTGIQGDNVFIKMLNPSSFSPILAIIGVFMLMRKENVCNGKRCRTSVSCRLRRRRNSADGSIRRYRSQVPSVLLLLQRLRRNRRRNRLERVRCSMDFSSRRTRKSLSYFPSQTHPCLSFR